MPLSIHGSSGSYADALAELRAENAELARMNRLLRAERDRARRESAEKSNFLANMSHELRTALNAVLGFTELLEQQTYGPLNPRQEQYVGLVRESGRHLLGLVNDVLDLSKIAAGRLELEREWIDPWLAAHAAIATVHPLAERKEIHVELDVPRHLPLVRADAVRLRQILLNLLSNAVKFTPSGGTVRVEGSLAGAYLRLRVSDTGIGIPKALLPRLFREFDQLDSPERGKAEGTGLGLALTRRLVELHGGRIGARSEAGRGSVFTVDLPLESGDQATSAAPWAGDEDAPSGAGPDERDARLAEPPVHAPRTGPTDPDPDAAQRMVRALLDALAARRTAA